MNFDDSLVLRAREVIATAPAPDNRVVHIAGGVIDMEDGTGDPEGDWRIATDDSAGQLHFLEIGNGHQTATDEPRIVLTRFDADAIPPEIWLNPGNGTGVIKAPFSGTLDKFLINGVDRVAGSLFSASFTGLGTGFTNVCSVTVPVGRWTLIAKGWWDWSIASLGETAEAELHDGTLLDNSLHIYPTLAGKTPFVLLATKTFPGGGTVNLRVKTSGLDGTQLAQSCKLSAVVG